MRARVAVAALGLAALAALPAAASTPARTQIIIYTPFTIDGGLKPGVRIVKIDSGSCWGGSLNSARSDAWRCASDRSNALYDPCYSGTLTWVACEGPSSKGLVRLNLTKPLPRNKANPPLNTNKTDPAEITLARGVTCGFSTGATGTVAGLRLNYGCSNGAWLLGDPIRTSALWHILYLPSLKATHASSMAIFVARW